MQQGFISMVFWRGAAMSLLLLFAWTAQGNAADKPPQTDLRVLVDVSGSMKQNDPENLRRAALRLLIGLVPDDARVGIWTFGQYVNMQVKPAFANEQWKKLARKEADKIHSRGLFTNIEATLVKSTWDWKKPAEGWNRHLILLTDGQVDISKDSKKNAASRSHILEKLLPQLKAAGVKLHTIALSKNADHELLKRLATETGGAYEPVESADTLNRVFLQLFEKSTPTDSLPLEGNRFEVDSSIEDMTLLVFRGKADKATRIIRPDNTSFEYGQLPKNVVWYSDKSFDLVTVRKPQEGGWKIDAAIDPDNRVKVITNLKLHISEIPNNILLGESVQVSASLQEEGGPVKSNEILNLVEMKIGSGFEGAEKQFTIMLPDKRSGNYSTQLQEFNEAGKYDVIISAIAPTFRRESRHTVRVHDNPVSLSISENDAAYVLDVTESPDIIQAGTLQLVLHIDGDDALYNLTSSDKHQWRTLIDKQHAGKGIKVEVHATLEGNRSFDTELHAILPKQELPMPEPFIVSTDETDAGFVIRVLKIPDVVQTGTVQLQIGLPAGDGGSTRDYLVIQKKDENNWETTISSSYAQKEIEIKASAHYLHGESYENIFTVMLPKSTQVKEDIVIEKVPEEKPHEDIVAEEGEEKHETNTVLVVSILVVVNLLLIAGGLFAHRRWNKRDPQADDKLGEGEAVEDTADTPAKEDDAPAEDFSAERKLEQPAQAVELGDGEDSAEPAEAEPAEAEPAEAEPAEAEPAEVEPAEVEPAEAESTVDDWAEAFAESGDELPDGQTAAAATDEPAVDKDSSETAPDSPAADDWAAAFDESGDELPEETIAGTGAAEVNVALEATSVDELIDMADEPVAESGVDGTAVEKKDE